VFQLLPQVVVDMDLLGSIKATVDYGPALLITHDCDLDKPRGTVPRIERLQFLPLRDLQQQDGNRQTLARSPNVQPPEPIYVGDVTGVGEAFGLLSEAYNLPAAFFTLSLEGFPNHPEADAGTRYLVAGSHANRLGRLEGSAVELMQRKISVYYGRRDPGPRV
jgi:hypothetical protein